MPEMLATFMVADWKLSTFVESFRSRARLAGACSFDLALLFDAEVDDVGQPLITPDYS